SPGVGEKSNRAFEIATGERPRLAALFALEPFSAGRLDLGADRSPQAQEQWQRDETRQGFRRLGGEIAVEEPVGGGAQAALLQVHQKKRQIVKDVPARNPVGKLDRIEQGRLAIDESNIPQVQVAVASTNKTGLAALEQGRPHNRECEPRILGELARPWRVKEIGPLGEGGVVLPDVGLKRVGGAQGVPRRRASVHAPYGKGQLVDDGIRN